MIESFKIPSATFPTLTGSIVTFNSQYAGLPLKSHTIALTATQSGSGTPSPSNPRPITGYSAIHIGNISDNTNISYFKGVLNGTYGFVDLGSLTWYMNTAGQFYTAQTNPTGEQDLTGSNLICSDKYTGGNAYTGDTDKTICIVGESLGRIWIKDSEYSDVTIFKNGLSGVYLIYELKTPTTPTPTITSAQFEALCEAFGMNGQSITVQIGSTVYGGEYDARTGVLTVTHKGLVFDGSSDENWVDYTVSGTVYYFIENALTDISGLTDKDNPICMCNIYQEETAVINSSFLTNQSDLSYCNQRERYIDRLWVINRSITTLADFKTALSNQNLVIVYPIATPQTIQLPPCPIDTLLGENNIWTDTGDTTLQYIKLG